MNPISTSDSSFLDGSSNRAFISGGVISHRMSLDEAPCGYEMFKKKEDDCEKVVLSALS